VDGREIKNGEQMLQAIGTNANRQLAITVLRDGKREQITATPQPRTVEQDGRQRIVGHLGFRPGINASNEVLGVTKDSAAQKAGLREGDRIVAVDGKPIANGDEMLLAISRRPGQAMDLTVMRAGERISVQATPQAQVFVAPGLQSEKEKQLGLKAGEPIFKVNGRPVQSLEEVQAALAGTTGPAKLTVMDRSRDGKQTEIQAPITAEMVRGGLLRREGRLGFLPGVVFERVGPVESVRMGMEDLQAVLLALGNMVKRNQLKENAGGPIMMLRMVQMNSHLHPGYTMGLVGQLSLSLAIFNLLPIPVLDGGHLAILGVEAIRRRRLDPAWHRAATAAGLLVIGILFLLLFYKDFTGWVTGRPLIQ
jgi:regulator of sigma E protease